MEARIRKQLTQENYNVIWKSYLRLKKLQSIDELLFFKSFVNICLRENEENFNEYIRYVSYNLLNDVLKNYYKTYKDNKYVDLYTTKMEHYEI